MDNSTQSLRAAAARWSLAGDQQLLGLLENIHQRILSKCQETNAKLDEMVNSLEDASIHLQNVNNKFMALSNSQFIESRVYDDGADTAAETKPEAKTPNKPTAESKAFALKQSLLTLASLHEPVRFINDSDSDTDSASDDVGCIVLKPKDQYSERPLPHIIGSYQWKTKWHAGVLKEHSDSDSSISDDRASDVEQYSSDEQVGDRQKDGTHAKDNVISSSSSEIAGDMQTDTPPVKPTPAEVAAELARRLGGGGGGVQSIPETSPPDVEPVRKLYKPQAPVSATIFSEEPPPLEQSEEDLSDEVDDDIFAELRRNKPYDHGARAPVATDLFAGLGYNDNMKTKPNHDADVIENTPKAASSVKARSTLFDEESEPELFVDKPIKTNKEQNVLDVSKKPVGGISLFGSNKGTESIGAAILKRNQRKSSSDDSSDDVTTQTNTIQETAKIDSKNINSQVEDVNDSVSKIEKDMFNHLFAKKEAPKNNAVPVKIDNAQKSEKENKQVNLFDDNIFDDIDDIFSTNIESKVQVKEIKKDNKQSIFDDDDDLFADIAVAAKQTKENYTRNKIDENPISEYKGSSIKTNVLNAQSIFDSDDDLFTNNSPKEQVKNVGNVQSKPNLNATKPILSKPVLDVKSNKKENSIFDDVNDNLFEKETEVKSVSRDTLPTHLKSNIQKKELQSPSLFDDDDDDLFNKPIKNKSDTATKEHNIQEINYNESKTNFDAENKVLNEAKKDYLAKSIDNGAKEASGLHKKVQKDLKTNTQEINIEKDEQNEIETGALNDSNVVNSSQGKDIGNENALPPLDSKSAFMSETKSSETNQNEIPDKIIQMDNSTKIVDDRKEKPPLFFDEPPPLPKAGIFAEILSEPPDFEKPKEPKKSKNVNALFDDDSDDEALFFKKNDASLDEKPAAFVNPVQDNLFGIFHDEPPAIDIDFEHKPSIIKNLPDDIEDELFLPKENIISQSQNAVEQESNTQSESPECEVKKIGKLKPSNLNINVHSLLPGVSPKKTQKSFEQIDGPVMSTQSNEASQIESKVKNTESQVKSVSFDGQPDSGVLDNKISKERAKIQVKRRPSSRRARKEAVRKSGIDFGEDSTDNSSSIDDPPKQIDIPKDSPEKIDNIPREKYRPKDVKSKIVYILNDEDIFTDTKPKENLFKDNTEESSKYKKIIKPMLNIVDDDEIFKSETKTEPNLASIGQVYPEDRKQSTKLESSFDLSDDDDIFKPKVGKNKNILNIENKTNVETYTEEVTPKLQAIETKTNIRIDTSLDFSGDDDIFKEKTSKTDNISKPDQKLNESYNKTLNTQETKKAEVNKIASIFDDDEDNDQLFGKSKISKKVDVKKSIFDSDSDEEVFGKKAKDLKYKDVGTKSISVRKTATAKGSLFGDDDNDDDLFGATSKKTEHKPPAVPTSSLTTKEPTKTDAVFDDPLSLLSE